MGKKEFDSWKSVIEEVKRYLDQDVDYFTVSSGPWTIEYDNRKESEVSHEVHNYMPFHEVSLERQRNIMCL